MNTRKPTRIRPKRSSPSSFKPKFLLRSLKITDHTEPIFKKVRTKRLYLKNILDERETIRTNLETVYKPFKHNKLLKSLKNIKIPSLSSSYLQESLKYSKQIKSFSLNSESPRTKIIDILNLLKKIPASIQSLRIEIVKSGSPAENAYLYRIAKSIRRLPNLQHFQRWFLLDQDQDKDNYYIPRELRNYSQTALRLRKLDRIVYCLGFEEQKAFQQTMRRGLKFPGINGLKMYLSSMDVSDSSVSLHWPFIGEDSSQEMDSILFHGSEHYFETDSSSQYMSSSFSSGPEHFFLHNSREVTSDTEPNCSSSREFMSNTELSTPNTPRKEPANDSYTSTVVSYSTENLHLYESNILKQEEMKPFYRFELFPDLKKLSIIQEDITYALGDFVVTSFSTLKKLEDLKLNIMCRTAETIYLFKGFLHLPLLRKFSLRVPCLKEKDWELFEMFMKSQINLESFSLSMQSSPETLDWYQTQNLHLGNILKDLQNKPRLRSLQLRSAFWSLGTLSKALDGLTMTNQLEEFKLEASDETIISQEKPWKRVEGLCNFIKNQKDSIKKLSLWLPCVLEDSILTHLAKAISKLTNLRELNLSANADRSLTSNTRNLILYFEYNLQEDTLPKHQRKMGRSKTWNPTLGKYFKRLENLEDFSLEFEHQIYDQKQQTKWLVDVMKTLPSLERLRKVRVWSAYGKDFLSVEEKISSAVLELENVRELRMMLFDGFILGGPIFHGLQQAARTVNQRQSMRCDLMF